VNTWLWAATALLLGVVPCGWLALRASRVDALVGLQTAGTLTTLVLVLLAEGFERSSYMGVALALAFLSFTGVLLIARFLGRHL
jgi:multisubunit Na+/H+ antiporter MnhF subunit